jgi:tight adherence protein B
MSAPRRLAAAAAAFSIVALLAPGGSAGAAGTQQTLAMTSDVTGYPDVRLVVAAPAEVGDQVLTASAFDVKEAGQVKPVQVEALPAEQLQVALVLDTSGSMSGAPLAAAKAAAQSFLNQLPAGVPVSVVGFGATAAVVSPLSSNRTAQQSAIAGLTARGNTALYDGVRAGLAQLPAAAGTRQVVVLLSDGGDTSSVNTLDPTADALAAAKVPVFAVELRTVESNPAALDRLASATGGRVVAAGDPAALGGAFDAIAKQLVRQYALTYRSSAGGPTDVDVTLTAATVQATGRARLELPALPAGAARQPAGSDARSGGLGSWAFVGGIVLLSLAMLGLLVGAVGSWTPKARGLTTRRRTATLADAAERAESLGDSIMRSHGGTAGIAAALDSAGVDVRVGELLIGVAAGSAVLLVIGALLATPLIGLVLALVVPLLARVVVDQLARRRRKQFADQLADTLQMLAGSLRAGHSLGQAIDTVARESESPTSEEFRRVTVETRLGRDFVEALASMRERIGNEDLEWVVEAVDIQREVGGDLAEILDSVTGTIRDRTKVRRQVAALSAEGRLSAWVLMILPFGLGAVMAVTNRNYMAPLFTTRTGWMLVAAAGAFLVAGGVWLSRIVKPTF